MSEESCSPSEALPRIEALLHAGKNCRLIVTGNSMLPFLHNGRDAVILTAFTAPVRKNEILFYYRNDDSCVLHRVYGFTKTGLPLLCGDAQSALEPIDPNRIIARVSYIDKNGKIKSCRSLGLRLTVWLWQRLRFCRSSLLKTALSIRQKCKRQTP